MVGFVAKPRVSVDVGLQGGFSQRVGLIRESQVWPGRTVETPAPACRLENGRRLDVG